jgi:hypothetical protein
MLVLHHFIVSRIIITQETPLYQIRIIGKEVTAGSVRSLPLGRIRLEQYEDTFIDANFANFPPTNLKTHPFQLDYF